MLGKNLKYSFKAIGKTILISFCISVIAAILGSVFLLFISDSLTSTPSSSAVMIFLYIANLLSSVLRNVAIAGPFLLVIVLLTQRFNRSMVGNESVLTFTLPVKPTTHIWTHVINTFFYSFIAVIFTAINVRIVDFANAIILWGDWGTAYEHTKDYLFFKESVSVDISLWFVFFALVICATLILFLAITLSTRFSQHKGAAKVFFFFTVIILLSILFFSLLRGYYSITNTYAPPIFNLIWGEITPMLDIDLFVQTAMVIIEYVSWLILIVFSFFFFFARSFFGKKIKLD